MNLSENRDTLREILVRADWKVIVLLSSDGQYEQEVRLLVQDKTFFYDRLVLSVDEKILSSIVWSESPPNYTKIAIALERARQEANDSDRYKHGASYYPALQLIEALYGKTREGLTVKNIVEFWQEIDDIRVLHYMLKEGLTFHSTRSYLLRNAFLGAMKRSNISLLEEIVRLLLESQDHDAMLTSLILRYLLEHPDDPHYERKLAIIKQITDADPMNQEYYLVEIATSENSYAWSLFRSKFENYVPEVVVSTLAHRRQGRAIDFLISQEPWIVKRINWRQIVLNNIARVDTLSTLIKYVNLDTKTNLILKKAAEQSPEVMEALLADPRTRVMDDLEDTLLAVLDGISSGQSKSAKDKRAAHRAPLEKLVFEAGVAEEDKSAYFLILTRDRRFDLKALTLREVRLLAYGLGRIVRSKVLSSYSSVGREIASVVGGATTTPSLADLLETDPPTLISLIARAIVFLDLTEDGLARWMLASGEKAFYRAARAVIENVLPVDEEQQVVRALLITLLRHEELSLRALARQFKTEGMSSENILLAIQLAGLALEKISRETESIT